MEGDNGGFEYLKKLKGMAMEISEHKGDGIPNESRAHITRTRKDYENNRKIEENKEISFSLSSAKPSYNLCKKGRCWESRGYPMRACEMTENVNQGTEGFLVR